MQPLRPVSIQRINPLISLKKEQIVSGNKIPTQINFNFTDSNLANLNQKRNNSRRWKFPPELLADLRYYALIQNLNSLSSQLIFVTYYTQKQQQLAVIKSTISLQGKISQEICRNLMQNPPLLNDLLINHYWLMEQVCDRLSLRYQNKYAWFTGVVTSIIILLIAPFLLYFLTINWVLKLIILSGLFGLFYLLISIFSKKYLSSIILQQLIFGLLSKNTARRQLGFILLRYFG